MQRVIDFQANTINQLSTSLRDTIIMQDTTRRLKTFDYKSEWTDVSGLIDLDQDTVSLDIENRESLIVVSQLSISGF